jgi:hypothetical protein
MPRVRWSRFTGVVGAAALIGALQYSDEIATLIAGGPEPEDTVVPGQMQVAAIPGVLEQLAIPFAGKLGGLMPEMGPLNCAYDVRRSAEVCASRRPTDSTFAVTSSQVRSTTGRIEADFNRLTSDTVVTTIAHVHSATDNNGHPTTVSTRSVQRFAGYASMSGAVMLNGVDTIYKSVQRGTGINRLSQVVHYSNVTLPVYDAGSRHLKIRYPMSGVVFTTREHQWATSQSTRPLYSTAIVYFDGTRRPHAYLDGKRYTIDLQTGLATPYAGS